MRSRIVLVNTTTKLPLDKKLVEKFHKKILNKDIIESFHFPYREFDINVFFVSWKELSKEIQLSRLPIHHRLEKKLDRELLDRENFEDYRCIENINPDFLGVFIPFAQETNGPLIKVSPEKILYHTFYYKKMKKIKMSLDKLYVLLLYKVILHELGHFFMFDVDHHHRDLDYYEWICSRISRHKKQEDINWDLDSLKRVHYHYHDYGHESIRDIDNDLYKHFEETLANRFTIEHNFTKVEKDIICKFIETQPTPYKYATSMKQIQNIDKLMKSWKDFKNESLVYKICNAGLNLSLVFKDIITKMENDEEITNFDFEDKFLTYCDENINSIKSLNSNKDFLYGYGLYRRLHWFYQYRNPQKAHHYNLLRAEVEKDDHEIFEIAGNYFLEKKDYSSALEMFRKALETLKEKSKKYERYSGDVEEVSTIIKKIEEIELGEKKEIVELPQKLKNKHKHQSNPKNNKSINTYYKITVTKNTWDSFRFPPSKTISSYAIINNNDVSMYQGNSNMLFATEDKIKYEEINLTPEEKSNISELLHKIIADINLFEKELENSNITKHVAHSNNIGITVERSDRADFINSEEIFSWSTNAMIVSDGLLRYVLNLMKI